MWSSITQWKKILCQDKAPPCDKPKAGSHGNAQQLFTWVLDDYQQKVVLYGDIKEEKRRDTHVVKTAFG